MYAQLGNIVFQGLLGFDSFEKKGSVTYAKHEIINLKPVLKPTGGELDEVTLSIKLRAEFINIDRAKIDLAKSRDEFEILPLVRGNGNYLGDFVITEITESDVHALADGTVIEAVLQLTLLEFVSADKLQQQQVSDRKKAFALGDKQPLALNIVQPFTLPQLAADDLSAINSQTIAVDKDVAKYENNVSARESIANRIKNGLQKIDDRIAEFNKKLEEITIIEDVQNILSEANQVRQLVQNFTFPVTSVDDLKENNRDLQTGVKALGTGSIELTNLVITRRA